MASSIHQDQRLIQVFDLEVTIFDIQVRGLPGEPNPYAVINLNGSICQTSALRATTDPRWVKETFKINVQSAAPIALEVELFHKGYKKSDFIGRGAFVTGIWPDVPEQEIHFSLSKYGIDAGKFVCKLSHITIAEHSELNERSMSTSSETFKERRSRIYKAMTSLSVSAKSVNSGSASLEDALNSFDMLLKILNGVAKLHPAAEAAMSMVGSAYNMVREQKRLHKGIRDLCEHIMLTLAITREVTALKELEGRLNILEELLMAVMRTVRLIMDYINEYQNDPRLAVFKFGLRSKMTSRMDDCRRDLAYWRRNLETALAIETRQGVQNIYGKVVQVDEKFDNMHSQFEEIRERVGLGDSANLKDHPAEMGCIQFLERLPRVYHRDTLENCLEGTCEDLLSEIYEWAIDKDQPPIFWLHGLAGIGKSTLATTFADVLREEKLLGADFFFSRNFADSRANSSVFTTIAYQLATRIPQLMVPIYDAVRYEPDIGESDISAKWKALIKGPLLKVAEFLDRQVVVVIDALDECDHPLPLISVIAQDIKVLPRWLKIFFTGRPEHNLLSAFKKMGSLVHQRRLSTSDSDIAEFVKIKMEDIADCYGLGSNWPGPEKCAELVKRAQGSFIWVRTAAAFIKDEKVIIPDSRLELVLTDSSTNLDDLYLKVLTEAFPSEDADSHNKMLYGAVIGTIVTIRNPLSASAIATLMAIPDRDKVLAPNRVDRAARTVYAVLDVPSDVSEVIQTIHVSFADFLTDPGRCTEKRLLVVPEMKHQDLATHCLQLMNEFLTEFDCDLDISKLNSEMLDSVLAHRRRIPSAMQYACCFWGFHLLNAKPHETHFSLVQTFYSRHLLRWLEVLSLLEEGVKTGGDCLRMALDWIKIHHRDEKDLLALVEDSHRFLKEFWYPITYSAAHVRSSALLLTPRTSTVFEIYGSQIKTGAIKIVYGVPTTWPSWNTTMDGHQDRVYSIAFSPSGTHVASGSADNCIFLWDVESGVSIGGALAGHDDVVTGIAFEPDGEHAVTGSMDGTLRRWNVIKGEAVGNPFRGHGGGLTSISMAKDGKIVVSASEDKTIRLWDSQTGRPIGNPLEGHTDEVMAVVLSSDGRRIVSGSKDRSLRTWIDRRSEKCTKEAHRGAIYCVAFSHDEKRIASGSEDKEIRIWDALSLMQIMDPLTGHAGHVHSVAFSQNGRLIVSGSFDATVRLWDAWSGSPVKILRTTDANLAVAFSPNSQTIIAANYDFSIRGWDVDTILAMDEDQAVAPHGSVLSCGWSHQGFKNLALGFTSGSIQIVDTTFFKPIATIEHGHSGPVYSVSFSANDKFIVSGSFDRTIRQWMPSTGECIRNPLIGHKESVISATYSTDTLRIVSGSIDGTVRTWNAVSGEQLAMCTGDPEIYVVGYSPDGLQFASGSSDHTLRIWDAESHTLIATDTWETHWITSLEYSSDSKHILATGVNGKYILWSSEQPEAVDLDKDFSRSILYDLVNGWLRDIHGRILCWLPSEYRSDFRPAIFDRHLLATPSMSSEAGFAVFDLSPAMER